MSVIDYYRIMNKTIIFLCSFFIIVSATPVQTSTDTVPYYMLEASSTFKVDVALMYAICGVESSCRSKAFNPNDGTIKEKKQGMTARSYGMFQIRLSTARSLGFNKNPKELFKADVNAYYAAKLLRHLYNKYDDTVKVVSAYNAGKYVTFNEKYVNNVLRNYVRYKIDKRF